MFKGLVANIAILISFISIRFLILNYQPKNRTFRTRLVSGIYYGILGIILMFFKVKYVPYNLVIDFSNIGVILAAIYDGIPASAVAFLIVGCSHLFLFGISFSSIIVIFIGAIMVISSSMISLLYRYSHIKKRMFTTLAGIFMICSFYPLFIKNAVIRWEILIYLWLGSIPGVILAFYYIQHLQALNEHFRTLKQESCTDFLTDLNNVRNFDRLFNYAIHTALEMEESISLLYIDIDYFKKINDTYGHLNGDALLKEFARVLMRNCRSFGTISRNGGEEFSIILLDCSSSQAYSIAERIRTSIEAHEFKLPNGKTAKITISVGVATYPEPVKDPQKLLAKADEALYIAKCDGRNKVALAKV